MTHPPQSAIDELASLRETLAKLRLREAQLCNEMRAETAQIGMPQLDVMQIAETAEEMTPPPGLRATAFTDLQPMGDLTEEDVAAALYCAETPMEPAIDVDAVLETEMLQAQLDRQIETEDLPQDSTNFATRRIIGAQS